MRGMHLAYLLSVAIPIFVSSYTYAANLRFQFDDQSFLELTRDPADPQLLEGSIIAANGSHAMWTVDGRQVGTQLLLDFKPSGSTHVRPSLDGTFVIATGFTAAGEEWNTLVPVETDGHDPELQRLLRLGEVNGWVLGTDNVPDPGLAIWTVDLFSSAAGEVLDNLVAEGLVRLMPDGRGALGQEIAIERGFEDLVVAAASERNVEIRQLRPDSGVIDLATTLVAPAGNVIPRDQKPDGRQRAVAEKIVAAIDPPLARHDLRPDSGLDYQLVLEGSWTDFGLNDGFKGRFYRLTYRLLVNANLKEDLTTPNDMVRVHFVGGSMLVDWIASSFDQIAGNPFHAIDRENQIVPEHVLRVLVDRLLEALQATKVS